MKARASARRMALGVSLIEALVALAVMAFGMLGVVGMQASLRNSAEQSKHRSEALRLAQGEIERLRAFDVLANYTAIATAAPVQVQSNDTVGYEANTVYTRTVTLQAAPTLPAVTPAPEPLGMKTVSVAVSWRDRTSTGAGDDRSVVLNTSIAGISPELGAGMGAPTSTSPPRRPGGRHISIPPSAVLQGDYSNFTPPGVVGSFWRFQNSTGLILGLCAVAVPPAQPVCTTGPFALLAGYIRFATGGAPTAPESENPVDDASLVLGPVGVEVQYTHPTPTGTVTCFASTPALNDTFIEYYCAVPLNDIDLTKQYWSGESLVTMPTGQLATAATDFSPTQYKVCRYTPDPSIDTPAAGNRAHPKVYTRVAESLFNQNFLVIEAGDGTTPFTCPIDEPTTPRIDGDTRLHQPPPP